MDDEKASILSNCLDNIEELDLEECKISTRGMQSLCKAIDRKSLPVSKYYIGSKISGQINLFFFQSSDFSDLNAFFI